MDESTTTSSLFERSSFKRFSPSRKKAGNTFHSNLFTIFLFGKRTPILNRACSPYDVKQMTLLILSEKSLWDGLTESKEIHFWSKNFWTLSWSLCMKSYVQISWFRTNKITRCIIVIILEGFDYPHSEKRFDTYQKASKWVQMLKEAINNSTKPIEALPLDTVTEFFLSNLFKLRRKPEEVWSFLQISSRFSTKFENVRWRRFRRCI